VIEMLVLGIVLMALAIFGFLEIGAYFQRADAPSWTKRGWIGETTAILFVFLIGLGSVSVISGLVDAAEQGLGAIDAGLAIGVIVLAILVGRWRRHGRRAAAAEPALVRLVDMDAADLAFGDTPSPPHGAQPAGAAMRRAA
jgi:hypothetical protein